MRKIPKRTQTSYEMTNKNKLYSLDEACALVKKTATAKFDETIDVSIILGIDAKKSDQIVRGATVLPNGTGKTVRVAVFAQGTNAEAAKNAGADLVGYEDLAEQIKSGKMDFDVLIATPDAMRIVSPLGAVLGPRGLMPNPKVGTVTMNVALAVTNAKGGQVTYRSDKNGNVHSIIGKASFDVEKLKQNLLVLLTDLKKARPANAKGIYFKKLTLSSTMGIGINLDLSTVVV